MRNKILFFIALTIFIASSGVGFATGSISSCQNITSSGSYILTTDLTLHQSSGRCIDIQANNVLIDCGVYTLTGNNTEYWVDTQYGIYSNSTNTTIQNCYVKKYADGIYLTSTANSSTVTKNRASNNTRYGIYMQSSNSVFSYNLVEYNDDGIYQAGGTKNKINGNVLNGQGDDGIQITRLDAGHPATYDNVTDNVGSNYYALVYLEYGGNHIVVNNTGSYSTGDSGFSLYYSTNNNITNNTASYNDYYGFYVESSPNNLFANNVANYNPRAGIFLNFGNDNVIISGSTFNYNEWSGIYVQDNTNLTITNNTASFSIYESGIALYDGNNTVCNNTVNSNALYGIYVGGNVNNTLIGNTAYNNSLYGYYVIASSDSGNNLLTNNIAYNNGLWDFYSAPWLTYSNANTIVTNLMLSQNTISFTQRNVAIKGMSSNISVDPANYTNINKFINATNTSATSFLLLNISYTDSDLNSVNANESSLFMTRNNGTLETITSNFANVFGVDATNNYVYANISSFGNTSGSIFTPLGTISSATYPQWSNNVTLIPSSYNASITSVFRITWTGTDAISKVFLESNYTGTPHNYSMVLQSGNIYNYSTIIPAVKFYWKSYANNSLNYWNTSDTWYFKLNDTIAPTVVIDIPQNTTYHNIPISFNTSSTDDFNLSSCWYSLNHRSNISLPYNTTLTPDIGGNYLQVYCNDTSGNEGTSNVTFTYIPLIDGYTGPLNVSSSMSAPVNETANPSVPSQTEYALIIAIIIIIIIICVCYWYKNRG